MLRESVCGEMAAVLALRAQVEEQRCYATNFKDEQNNINALPREMLVRILQKLPVDCAATFASVCQTWRRATEDSGLWRYWCMNDWACTIRWSIVDEVRVPTIPSPHAAVLSRVSD